MSLRYLALGRGKLQQNFLTLQHLFGVIALVVHRANAR